MKKIMNLMRMSLYVQRVRLTTTFYCLLLLQDFHHHCGVKSHLMDYSCACRVSSLDP
jgi:hypothetical protein